MRDRIDWSITLGRASVKNVEGKDTDGWEGVRKGGGTWVECGQSVVKGVGKDFERPGYTD